MPTDPLQVLPISSFLKELKSVHSKKKGVGLTSLLDIRLYVSKTLLPYGPYAKRKYFQTKQK